MKFQPLRKTAVLLLSSLVGAVVLLFAGSAMADDVVGASKVIIVSNDISNQTTAVFTAAKTRSGLLDA